MTRIGKQRRGWTHKSVRALMRSASSDDPIEIIQRKTREIVAWAKKLGWSGPPFDPLQLASLRGIKSRQSTNLFSADAQLTPMDGNQLLLEFNPDRSNGRKNYSISHELVHTLFDDCFEMVHQRRSNRSEFDPESEVELLCQIGAAEFLMPAEDFQRDLRSLPFSLASVSTLGALYGASREACARRMVDLAGGTAALVFLSLRQKPTEIRDGSVADAKLRVLYCLGVNGFPAFLPEHKSAPDHSCVYRAISVDEVVSGYEEWDILGFGRRFVEAMALPIPDTAGPDSPSVIALVHTER